MNGGAVIVPPPSGPRAVRLIDTTDVDEARLAYRRIYADAVIEPIRGAPFGCTFDVVSCGAINVVAASWPGGGRIAIPLVCDRYVLWFSAGGTASGEHGGVGFAVTPGRGGALFSAGRGAVICSGASYQGHTIAIERGALEAHLRALTGHEPRGPIAFDVAVDLEAGPGATVFDVASAFRREVQRPDASPFLIAVLRDALLTSLLTNTSHTAAALLASPPRPATQDCVRMAEEYIAAHASEPITLADVAAAARVPARSLQAAFLARRGTTPAAFLAVRRREQARAALVAELDGGAGHAQAIAAKRRIASLSPRERQVGELVARGLLNKQVAAELGITERTVKEYRGQAMRKLGARSAAELGSLFRLAGM